MSWNLLWVWLYVGWLLVCATCSCTSEAGNQEESDVNRNLKNLGSVLKTAISSKEVDYDLWRNVKTSTERLANDVQDSLPPIVFRDRQDSLWRVLNYSGRHSWQVDSWPSNYAEEFVKVLSESHYLYALPVRAVLFDSSLSPQTKLSILDSIYTSSFISSGAKKINGALHNLDVVMIVAPGGMPLYYYYGDSIANPSGFPEYLRDSTSYIKLGRELYFRHE